MDIIYRTYEDHDYIQMRNQIVEGLLQGRTYRLSRECWEFDPDIRAFGSIALVSLESLRQDKQFDEKNCYLDHLSMIQKISKSLLEQESTKKISKVALKNLNFIINALSLEDKVAEDLHNARVYQTLIAIDCCLKKGQIKEAIKKSDTLSLKDLESLYRFSKKEKSLEPLLQRAIRYGDIEFANYLYKRGVSILSKDSNGMSCLHKVVDAKTAGWILEKEHSSLLINDQENVILRTPLAKAVENVIFGFSDSSLIWLLLDYGAKIDLKNCDGQTVLHELTFSQNGLDLIRAVPCFLDLKEEKDRMGRVALQYSVFNNNEQIFEELLNQEADPFIQDSDGNTIFHAMVSLSVHLLDTSKIYRFIDILQHYLSKDEIKKLVNTKNFDGKTPLEVIARQPDIVNSEPFRAIREEMFILLNSLGARCDLTNYQDLTPLDLLPHKDRALV